jgi:hypothetical protein
MMWHKFVLAAVLGWFFGLGLVWVPTFMTGSTFGQRCANLLRVDDPREFSKCVKQLARGGP